VTEEPLDVGITQWEQSFEIVPHGKDSLVRVRMMMKLNRLIPRGWRNYAFKEMHSSAGH